MRSSHFLAAALLALACACSTRGTGPESIEVGGECDPDGDFNACEETCLGNARMCVFRCASDTDCPSGSVCTTVRLDEDDNPYVCLPLCSTVPCQGYDQGLCCGPVGRVNGGTASVCYTSAGGTGFTCGGGF